MAETPLPSREHQSDCVTNGFDMPDVGIVFADRCSCDEAHWVCPRCGLRRVVASDIGYIEHWCADGEIQSLDVLEI